MANATAYVHGPTPVSPPFGRVMVAKTTHMGDLVISLPLAAALKRRDPGCTVIYLTNAATAEVARRCPAIDEVVTVPASTPLLPALLASLRLNFFIQVNHWRLLAVAAQLAAIPVRIGALFRIFNRWRCTHLVAIARATSGLNKRELDLQYLAPLGIGVPDRHIIVRDGQLAMPPPPPQGAREGQAAVLRRIARERRAIILSPACTAAPAHRWPADRYAARIDSLDWHRYHWFICGLATEHEQLQPLLSSQAGAVNVTDLVGRLSLTEFMRFIVACDGVIGGSTWPVHLAAAPGVRTLGLYQSRPGDVARWRPLGPHVNILHSGVRCLGVRRGRRRQTVCPCITAIRPAEVAAQVSAWFEREKPGAAEERSWTLGVQARNEGTI